MKAGASNRSSPRSHKIAYAQFLILLARSGQMKIDMRVAAVLGGILCQSAQAEGDVAAGKTAFANQCAVCHTVVVGKNGFGPSLAEVIGRHSGGLQDYNYSTAMTAAGLIWQPDTLDAFLTSSTAKVPGTTMPVAIKGQPRRRAQGRAVDTRNPRWLPDCTEHERRLIAVEQKDCGFEDLAILEHAAADLRGSRDLWTRGGRLGGKELDRRV